MPRNTLVRQVMTPDPLVFRPGDGVDVAARALSDRNLGGAPVVNESGELVGLLEDDDLILQDARIHFPNVISVFGAYLELPSSLNRFEKELRKAVGATVGDVMDPDPPACTEDDNLETVATVMHDRGVVRLPVVSGPERKVVGIVSRGDILKAIVQDSGQAEG